MESINFYRTFQMIEWLSHKTKTSCGLAEAFLSGWVFYIRDKVLSQYITNHSYNANLILTDRMCFSGDYSGMLKYFRRHTKFKKKEIILFLSLLCQKFNKLSKAKKAFEPLGIIESKDSTFHITLWDDFLSPKIEGPASLVEGIGIFES